MSVPIVWLGHDQKHPFKVWKYVDGCSGVIVNACQFFERPASLKLATEQGIQKALEHERAVFLDSGGYQFQRDGKVSTTPAEILDLHKRVSPDIGAILDVPLNPLDSSIGNYRRWRKTLHNTAYMYNSNCKSVLVPVFHAYSLSVIGRRYAELNTICSDPPMVCVGSLVPLIRGSHVGKRFTRRTDRRPATYQRWRFIVRLILRIRKHYRKPLLHVFGAGSLSTMYILFLLGVESVDSASWRVKAAYGAIQLPGTADRYPAPRSGTSRIRRRLGKHDRKLLEECDCPICTGRKMKSRIRSLARSFENRAIHNAHTFISETSRFREAASKGFEIEFVRERLKNSPKFLAILEKVIIPELYDDVLSSSY